MGHNHRTVFSFDNLVTVSDGKVRDMSEASEVCLEKA